MSRTKQAAPPQVWPPGAQEAPPVELSGRISRSSSVKKSRRVSVSGSSSSQSQSDAGLLQLAICVGGIYASFLSWGVLQEAITTITYTNAETGAPERFTFSVFLNTVQSIFAAITAFVYLYLSTPRGATVPSPFPTRKALTPLFLIAISNSLASPFGYASLAHIDYLTFVLAKSCKLLPVMFLQLTIFRRRYPLYKYAVVGLVTLGVATFTLHHPKSASASSKHQQQSTPDSDPSLKSPYYGLFLLSVNLLLDGLTNSTQDHMFSSPHLYTKFSGPQMMCAVNLASTALTATWLLLSPFVTLTSGALQFLLPLSRLETSFAAQNANELSSAVAFLARHPEVAAKVLAFAACGAVGQLFIFYALARFSSLVLVTVTVTRKMLTMLLSVVWFGHRLQGGQWLGVLLVFGGITGEAFVKKKPQQQQKQKLPQQQKKLPNQNTDVCTNTNDTEIEVTREEKKKL